MYEALQNRLNENLPYPPTRLYIFEIPEKYMVFGKSVQFEALLLFIILFFIQKINKGPLDAPIFSGFIKLWCQKLIKKQQGHLGKHPEPESINRSHYFCIFCGYLRDLRESCI
jgi:hypothetical protein